MKKKKRRRKHLVKMKGSNENHAHRIKTPTTRLFDHEVVMVKCSCQ